MPAKSAPQILSLNYECTFRFSNFQMIGLCSSSPNSLFCKILLITAPPEVLEREVFFSKNYKLLKLYLDYIHHILDF